MTVVVNDERTQGKELVYTESLWTGRRTIAYDGRQAEKKSRNRYLLRGEDGETEILVKSGLFSGTTLLCSLFSGAVEVRRRFTVLESVFAVLSIVLGIVCGMLGGWVGGVIGGALQGLTYGALGGVFFGLVAFAIFSIKRKWLRYLVCIELLLVCAGLAFFTGYGLALLRVAAAK